MGRYYGIAGEDCFVVVESWKECKALASAGRRWRVFGSRHDANQWLMVVKASLEAERIKQQIKTDIAEAV